MIIGIDMDRAGDGDARNADGQKDIEAALEIETEVVANMGELTVAAGEMETAVVADPVVRDLLVDGQGQHREVHAIGPGTGGIVVETVVIGDPAEIGGAPAHPDLEAKGLEEQIEVGARHLEADLHPGAGVVGRISGAVVVVVVEEDIHIAVGGVGEVDPGVEAQLDIGVPIEVGAGGDQFVDAAKGTQVNTDDSGQVAEVETEAEIGVGVPQEIVQGELPLEMDLEDGAAVKGEGKGVGVGEAKGVFDDPLHLLQKAGRIVGRRLHLAEEGVDKIEGFAHPTVDDRDQGVVERGLAQGLIEKFDPLADGGDDVVEAQVADGEDIVEIGQDHHHLVGGQERVHLLLEGGGVRPLGEDFHMGPVGEVGNGDGDLQTGQGALVKAGDIGIDVEALEPGLGVAVEIEGQGVDQGAAKEIA